MGNRQLMVFSIDQRIECIEQFGDGLMFISTPQRVMLYDLCTSTIIASSKHCCVNNQQSNNNNNQQKQSNNSNQNNNQLSSIQMHYFPLSIIQNQSLHQQQSTQFDNNNNKEITTIGNLLVHYKLKGISIYNINKILPNNNIFINEEQNKYEIVFNNFTQFMFGSAFLKLAFTQSYLKQLHNQQQSSLSNYLIKNQHIQIKQMQNNIDKYKDYQLVKLQKKCRQFYVFVNQSQSYLIKRIKLQEDGRLFIQGTYQLDQQSAQLSLSTVTSFNIINYFKDHNVKQQNSKRLDKLILGMEGGNIYIYQLPYQLKTNTQFNTTKQHYIQPISIIYLQQYIQSSTKTIQQKQKQQQDLLIDYSIQSIQLISDVLGIVLVRRCGLYLVDFNTNKIITKIQHKLNTKQQQSSIKSNRLSTKKNNKSKQSLPNDIKLCKLIYTRIQSIHQQNQSISNNNQLNNINSTQYQQYQLSPIKKHLNISATFIISTSNQLIKLTLTLSVVKQLHLQNNTCQPSVHINNITSAPIEQINTTIIQNINITTNSSHQNTSQSTQSNQIHNINSQIYGHFKSDKIFITNL